jgi:hypothetical protein
MVKALNATCRAVVFAVLPDLSADNALLDVRCQMGSAFAG